MTDNELNVTTTCILSMANQPDSHEKIKLLLNSLFASYKQEGYFECNENSSTRSFSSKLLFTQKEIALMPKTFKKEFRVDGCTTHIRRRKSGKGSYTYEIRYRRNGYNFSVTNKNLETVKRLFLEKLKTAERAYKTYSDCKTLDEFALYYFEKFRKPKVTEQTYTTDLQRYNRHIKPNLGSKQLKRITPDNCQKLIDSLLAEGKGKTANEIYGLLSVIFKGAIAHKLMDSNPLAIVVKTKHQSKHGTALTKAEESLLLQAYPNTKYQTLFALALYTGLRPNEYNTARIEGTFIVAVNSKRKNKRVEYKKIPITPMLAPYVQGIKDFEIVNRDVVREKFKAVLPDHILYDMRTTFYSRCKECGIADAARDEFVGHSLGALGNAYTDLSDEYLLREGQKFQY